MSNGRIRRCFQVGSFTFDAPVLTQVDPDSAAPSGSRISISGMNFGSIDYTPTLFALSTVCMTTSWTAATRLGCHLRRSAMGVQPVFSLSIEAVRFSMHLPASDRPLHESAPHSVRQLCVVLRRVAVVVCRWWVPQSTSSRSLPLSSQQHSIRRMQLHRVSPPLRSLAQILEHPPAGCCRLSALPPSPT